MRVSDAEAQVLVLLREPGDALRILPGERRYLVHAVGEIVKQGQLRAGPGPAQHQVGKLGQH